MGLELFPEDFVAVRVEKLSVPSPWPQLCFKMSQALVEIDLEQHRLRFIGELELKLPDSFLCPSLADSQALDWLLKNPMEAFFAQARSELGLQDGFLANAQIVWDLDDQQYCADLGTGDRSFLRLSYASRTGNLIVEAPVAVSKTGLTPERFLVESPGLFLELGQQKTNLPASRPLRCGQGDRGPKSAALRSRTD